MERKKTEITDKNVCLLTFDVGWLGWEHQSAGTTIGGSGKWLTADTQHFQN